MSECIILVGPPGSGKSTLALQFSGHVHINQDSQGKEHHIDKFHQAIVDNKDIVVDRMGFSKVQRERYILPAKLAGYSTKIIVLHESYDTCLQRMSKRENHPTIKDAATAEKVLKFFFKGYERVELDEADMLDRRWPESIKPLAVYSDLDGTLCDVEHRRHFVRREGKKDWQSFFRALKDDTVNNPVMDILHSMNKQYHIVYCSGRPDTYKEATLQWLSKHQAPQGDLFMRLGNDNRQDNIVKEILLDFEILTRYEVYFCLDDRNQVVEMLRSRGLKVFQVAPGDF